MIITLAPFPSMEYIYGVEKLKLNGTSPSKSVAINVLSKGIYSAQMMKVLQEEPILLSSMGGFVGKYIKHYLDKSKVKSDIVWTDYETPHAVKITEESTTDAYTLNNMEHAASDKELYKLTQKLKCQIKNVSTMVIAGTLPSGVSPLIYKEWIAEGKRYNVKTILSAGQIEVLEAALEEKPYGLMFSLEQLKVLGIDTSSYESLCRELAIFLKQGVHYIGVYLKDRGALLLSKNKYCLIESPFLPIHKNNTATTGAFLGAFAIGVSRKYEQEKFAKLCLASAIAANDEVSRAICAKKDVDCLIKKVKVRELQRI